ncbi:NUMOD4 domain-containing protein [Bacillus toyonensis]
MEETWFDIKGYEGIYQVSNVGRFRSLDRIGQSGRFLEGKIKVRNGDPYGFKTIKLYKDGKPKNHNVAKIIKNTFPEGIKKPYGVNSNCSQD